MTIAELAPRPSNIMQRGGFVALLAYFCSPMIGEWSMKLLGLNLYLAVTMGILIPILWLASGSTLRGLRHNIGLWIAGFFAWLLIATPFSYYRTGSLLVLYNYGTKSYLIFFYITAFVLTMRQLRSLIYLQVALTIALLATCFAFGRYSDDVRFYIPGGFFTNSNELAMDVLIGIPLLVFVFTDRAVLWKFAALGGIVVSVLMILRTGSRGGLIGGLVYAGCFFLFSKRKIAIALIGALFLIAGFIATPARTVNRILQIGSLDEHAPTDMAADLSATSRIELLKLSIQETITHPVFGVGPGMFAAKVAGEKQARGEWSSWLGTHNTYTQVSSESGIPGLILYCGVIILCFRTNYKIFRLSRNNPACQDLASLSLLLFTTMLIISVCTFFFHLSYSGALPTEAGITVALYLIAKPRLEQELGVKLA